MRNPNYKKTCTSHRKESSNWLALKKIEKFPRSRFIMKSFYLLQFLTILNLRWKALGCCRIVSVFVYMMFFSFPSSPWSSSYLDLQIDVDDKQFDFKLFDKRDAFPFSVVRMPHLQSNMPSKMFLFYNQCRDSSNL